MSRVGPGTSWSERARPMKPRTRPCPSTTGSNRAGGRPPARDHPPAPKPRGRSGTRSTTAPRPRAQPGIWTLHIDPAHVACGTRYELVRKGKTDEAAHSSVPLDDRLEPCGWATTCQRPSARAEASRTIRHEVDDGATPSRPTWDMDTTHRPCACRVWDQVRVG